MHRLRFAAFAVGKTCDEFDEAFVRLMTGFLFHDRQAQPFGILKLSTIALRQASAPQSGCQVAIR